MPWKITKNNVDPSGAGIQSHPNVDEKLCTRKFRLYDDDDNLYFEGAMYERTYDSEHVVAPLDWAMAYAGCTYMKILEEGKWNIL